MILIKETMIFLYVHILLHIYRLQTLYNLSNFSIGWSEEHAGRGEDRHPAGEGHEHYPRRVCVRGGERNSHR